MTGLTRETVTRILKKWQNSGKISVLEKRFIRINSEFLMDLKSGPADLA